MTDRQSSEVLIVGGGAGGLECAIRLARSMRRGRLGRVTLVDPVPAHVWKPRLHEVATGLLMIAEEQASYAEQAVAHGFTFVLGAVKALDARQGIARISAVQEPDGPAELLPPRTLRFDTVVLAIGSTIDDFGIPGVLDHCYVLDTAAGADRLHRAILAQATRVSATPDARLRIAIVGAGSTGVELAAELRSATRELALYRSLIDPGRVDVLLLEMADRPLPGVATDTSEYARRLLDEKQVMTRFKAKVAKVTAGELRLADGDVINADILVWASGVHARALDVTPAPGIERGGRMRVDPMLRVLDGSGRVVDGVYAIGDCAACFEPGHNKPVGATAQAAHQQARLLARSLAGQLRGRAPLGFRFRYRGTLVSLGGHDAAGDVPVGRAAFIITGAAAKLAYLALYRAHLIILFGWSRTTAFTVSAFLRRSAAPSIKLHW